VAGIDKGITSYGTQRPVPHLSGEWTPTLKTDLGGTITLEPADWRYYGGRYVRKDNTVSVTFFFKVASVSSPVGPMRLGGLPFLIDNASAVAISVKGLAGSPNIGSIICAPQSRSLFGLIEGFGGGETYELVGLVAAGTVFSGQFEYQTPEGIIANPDYLLDERETVLYGLGFGFDNNGVGLSNDGLGFGDELNPSYGGNFGGFLV